MKEKMISGFALMYTLFVCVTLSDLLSLCVGMGVILGGEGGGSSNSYRGGLLPLCSCYKTERQFIVVPTDTTVCELLSLQVT